MKASLIELAHGLEVELSGSVLAVAAERRCEITAELSRSGLWTHTDFMAGRFRGQPGLEVDEIRAVATVQGSRIDAHLMCEDVAPVVDSLTAELPGATSIKRVTIHAYDTPSYEQALVYRDAFAELWVSVDPTVWVPEPELLKRIDGLIVMLTPPGQPGHAADLTRLETVRFAAQHTGVGVDGGVSEANLSEIAAAGARYAVAGRALLS